MFGVVWACCLTTRNNYLFVFYVDQQNAEGGINPDDKQHNIVQMPFRTHLAAWCKNIGWVGVCWVKGSKGTEGVKNWVLWPFNGFCQVRKIRRGEWSTKEKAGTKRNEMTRCVLSSKKQNNEWSTETNMVNEWMLWSLNLGKHWALQDLWKCSFLGPLFKCAMAYELIVELVAAASHTVSRFYAQLALSFSWTRK